jgi:hypothetical protein
MRWNRFLSIDFGALGTSKPTIIYKVAWKGYGIEQDLKGKHSWLNAFSAKDLSGRVRHVHSACVLDPLSTFVCVLTRQAMQQIGQTGRLEVGSSSFKKLMIETHCVQNLFHSAEITAPELRELSLPSFESIHLEEHQLHKLTLSTDGVNLTYKDRLSLENIRALVVKVDRTWQMDWDAALEKTIDHFPSLSSLVFQYSGTSECWPEQQAVTIERFATNLMNLTNLTLTASMLQILQVTSLPRCKPSEYRLPRLVRLECGLPHPMTDGCFNAVAVDERPVAQDLSSKSKVQHAWEGNFDQDSYGPERAPSTQHQLPMIDSR